MLGLASNRFVLKIARFESGLFVLTLVLGRYILILLAETAHSPALGPKGEEYLSTAVVPEKSSDTDLRVRALFESYFRYESLFWTVLWLIT